MDGDRSNPVQQALLSLAEKAGEEGLTDYLVIGGNAVVAYGVPRFTRDVDFVIPERELDRWRRFLEANGFPFIHGTRAFAQFQDREGRRPRVDLMIVEESTWGKLSAKAWSIDFGSGVSAGLVAPDHLIAMKLQACRAPQRRSDALDWSDVVELAVRLGFDPETDLAFGELVLKYGGEELRKRLIDEIAKRKSS